jgi:hypothetical protein
MTAWSCGLTFNVEIDFGDIKSIAKSVASEKTAVTSTTTSTAKSKKRKDISHEM